MVVAEAVGEVVVGHTSCLHVRINNCGADEFETAVDRYNLSYNSVGENIASGPLTAVQFIEQSWDKSPGHKENMLGDWTEGCAGVQDIYAVFIFAK